MSVADAAAALGIQVEHRRPKAARLVRPIRSPRATLDAILGPMKRDRLQRTVEDGATVPIYYEGRLARISLDDDAKARLDEEFEEFEEITESEEAARKDQLKSRWAALEAVVGDENRLELIAADLVEHFERRREAMEGKAMAVCMSRRICVDLY